MIAELRPGAKLLRGGQPLRSIQGGRGLRGDPAVPSAERDQTLAGSQALGFIFRSATDL